jgi:ubiquinone biosynthesis protein
MKQFDLYLDNDLVLLVKTLIHIEGMGRQIYPELDFWSIAHPFINKWINEKYSVKGLIKYLVSKKHILTYMILKKIEESRYKFEEGSVEET